MNEDSLRILQLSFYGILLLFLSYSLGKLNGYSEYRSDQNDICGRVFTSLKSK